MNNIQDTYSNFIILRTYSRWLEDKQRRETWQDSVYRYRDFLLPKVPDSLKNDFLEAIEAVIRKEIMPSMRLLWTAGKAAEIDNVSAYNCFSGDTEFVTTEGIKQLKETGKHNVMVADGSTIEADVYCFGKQTTKEVIFKRNSYTKVVKATDKHNWKLLDGTEKTTDQLVYGDKIKFVFNRPTINTKSIDYNLGIKHGFIYGDGTLQKRKNTYSQQRDAGYFIRVCSDIEDTLKYFGEYPVTYPKSFNGNPVIMMCDSFAKTHALKELPDENETLEYLLGFFRGWFAADGYISKQNQIRLTCKKEVIPWLNSVLPRLGIYTQRMEDLRTPTNFGERKQETTNVFLDRATLIKDDFILPRKQMLFKPYKVLYYTFNSIDNSTAREEDVYCAVVPEYKEFVLNQGLLTGNCAYTPIDKINRFHEILYLLMNGVGVGYSVERQYIAKLPTIACQVSENEAEVYTVQDSKEGWALAFKHLVKDWYLGIPSTWDVSKVRPKGALIKTFGGRASGSGVLVDLFTFTKQLIFNALGRRLNSKEISDIVCKIADIVICGGVRRSACICFSNLSDPRMASYKEGQFWLDNPQRALANISVAYTEKPDMAAFIEEWKTLIQSGTGERGIINVECLPDEHMRMNPCAERALRPQQLCNLSEVVVSAEITQNELLKRVRLATLLGTIQATLTQFNTRVLSKEWVNNTIEDAMLGVSLTGTSNKLWTPEELQELRNHAIVSNERYAKVLNINKAYGITCNKPSGCQTPETLLITNKGILTLEEIGDIHGDTWQEHNLVIAQEKDSAKSTKFYNNGKTLVKRLYMASGVNLEATLNHQYRVLDKGQYVWKAVKDIVEGDIIPYRVGGYGESTQQHFYQSLTTTEAPYHNCKPIIQPLKLNEDIAYLLGLYTGDGSNHGKGIRIAGNYKDQAPLIKAMDIAKKHFGIEGTIYTRNKGENADLYLNSTWLLSFLQANGLSKDKTEFIDIPKLIRMSPKSVIEAFIEGYADADGCVTAQGEIVICTISEKMAKTLPIVWRAIGQDCTVKLMPPTQTSWGSKMRYRITAIKGRQGDYCKDTQRVKHFKELDTLNLTTLNPDTVIGVEYYESTTHDIEVPENNTYVANSYISHNTVSQVVGCSSGIHPDYSEYYIRRVRVAKVDPICQLLINQKVPHNPEVGTSYETTDTMVFEFPIKGSAFRTKENCTAIEQLEYYKLFKTNWCDERGNPSCTVYVKESEWLQVGAWVYENWSLVGGLSFLPADGGVYQLAPYTAITKEEYEKLCNNFPTVDFSVLKIYEKVDTTVGAKEYACSAGQCELK